MKNRAWLIFALLFLFAFSTALWLMAYEPAIVEGSTVTKEGILTDRAMSDGKPYLSVEFADGASVCCWILHKDVVIPEEIAVGDPVRITYGVEADRGRYVIQNVVKTR